MLRRVAPGPPAVPNSSPSCCPRRSQVSGIGEDGKRSPPSNEALITTPQLVPPTVSKALAKGPHEGEAWATAPADQYVRVSLPLQLAS